MLTVICDEIGIPSSSETVALLRMAPEKIRVIGIDARKDPLERCFVDACYQVPKAQTPEWVSALQEIIEKENACCVIPQSDRPVMDTMGLPFLFDTECDIEIAADKARLLSQAGAWGIPTPEFVVVSTRDGLRDAVFEMGYPNREVVIKPVKCGGARGFRIASSKRVSSHAFFDERATGTRMPLEEILAHADSDLPELMVMEYLPGKEFSIDCFVGSEVVGAVCRERLTVLGGVAGDCIVVDRQELCDQSLTLARNLKMKYTFGFQFKCDEGGTPKLLECNPRIQGTMIASGVAGVNCLWLGLQEYIGKPPAEFPKPHFGVRFTRGYGGLITGVGEAKTLPLL